MASNQSQDPTVELVWINGKRMWKASDNGQLFHYVSGGADDGDAGDDTDEETEDGEDDKTPPAKKFSQADLNRTARAERKAAETKLAKSLGFETVEAMKAALSDKKNQDAKETKDLDTAVKNATTAEARASKAESDLAQERQANKVFRALVEAGLSAKAADRTKKLVEIDPEADDDEISEAITVLREDMPELFPSNDDDDVEKKEPKKVNPPNTGGARRKSGGPGDSKKTARDLLYERHPNLKKQDTH